MPAARLRRTFPLPSLHAPNPVGPVFGSHGRTHTLGTGWWVRASTAVVSTIAARATATASVVVPPPVTFTSCSTAPTYASLRVLTSIS